MRDERGECSRIRQGLVWQPSTQREESCPAHGRRDKDAGPRGRHLLRLDARRLREGRGRHRGPGAAGPAGRGHRGRRRLEQEARPRDIQCGRAAPRHGEGRVRERRRRVRRRRDARRGQRAKLERLAPELDERVVELRVRSVRVRVGGRVETHRVETHRVLRAVRATLRVFFPERRVSRERDRRDVEMSRRGWGDGG